MPAASNILFLWLFFIIRLLLLYQRRVTLPGPDCHLILLRYLMNMMDNKIVCCGTVKKLNEAEKRYGKFGETSLNNWSISKSQLEPGVRKGKRSLLAFYTHCKCSMEITRNSGKFTLGIKVITLVKSYRLWGNCNWSRVRMSIYIRERETSYCWIRSKCRH